VITGGPAVGWDQLCPVIIARQRYLWPGENDYNTRGVHIGNGQGLGCLAGPRGLTGKIREDNSLKILHRLLLTLPLFSGPAIAMDYSVDFSRIDNLESIRPLVQQCGDFDALEIYRSKMESSTNLEELRSTLSSVGFALFNKCPDNITGPGIAPVKQPEASLTMDYSVDFTRVKNFEVLRPLIEECRDFGGLEAFRDRLQTTPSLDDMRKTLTSVGFGMFEDCPRGISGPGITPSQ
jgi:hypothetical protein